MVKLKNFAIVILTLVIVLTNIPIYAYIGEVDIDDNINISNIQGDGSGSITISRDIQNGYKLSYQWVEIENSIYKQIKKLNDELTIIGYFNLYAETESDEDYETYYLAQQYFKNTYGEIVTDATPNRIKAIRVQINSLLPEHNGTWKTTTNNNYNIDLGSFEGTKDYVLWVELEKPNGTKVYDAKVFELTGTKQNSNVSNEKVDPVDNISISDISNGKGTINISRDVEAGYELYYQWVEVNTETYKQIKKLKDELKVIGYFNLYAETESDEDYETYILAQQYYKEKYGENVKDATSARIKEIRESINKLTPVYTETWTKTTDNKYSIDLSSFEGTKYYTLWAKLVKKDGTIVYDSRTFELTGTKVADEPSTDKPGTDDSDTDEPSMDKPGTDDPDTDEPSTDKPGTDDLDTDEPSTDKPGTDDPDTDEPSTDKPGTDDLDTDEPSTDKPGTDNPSTSKTNTNNSNKNDNTSKVDTKSDSTYIQGDTTTSKSNLAYTGMQKSVAIGGICIFLGISMIMFIKYKNIV